MTAWLWIDERDALAVHDRSLLLHGGAPGLRDRGLLESALARPRQLAAYEDPLDLARLGAAYTFGLLRNHPFVDGNKRTGFIVGVLFLEINNGLFAADEGDAASAVIALADGSLDEGGHAAFLRANMKPA